MPIKFTADTRVVRVTLIVMTSLLLVSSVAWAQEKTKTGSDPTDFITRYEPSYEHKKMDNGNELDVFVLRIDLALRRDISLRLDLPLIDFEPESRLKARGFDSKTGLGDIIAQFAYKAFSDDKKALLFGLRFDLDTASEDELGQGGTTVAPLVVAAWYPSRQWIFAPVFQWFVGDELDNDPLPGERDRDELSYRQVIIWQPMTPYVSWLMLDPEFIVDFENDDETTFQIGLEYGKMTAKTVAFFIKPTFHAGGSDQTLDWSIRVGFRHMFPKKTFLK